MRALNNLSPSNVAAQLHGLGTSFILNSAFHANHISVCFKALIRVLWPKEKEKLEIWATVGLDKLWVRWERQWSGELMSSPSRGQEFKLRVCRMGGPKRNAKWFKTAEGANVQGELPWGRTQAAGRTRFFCHLLFKWVAKSRENYSGASAEGTDLCRLLNAVVRWAVFWSTLLCD